MRKMIYMFALGGFYLPGARAMGLADDIARANIARTNVAGMADDLARMRMATGMADDIARAGMMRRTASARVFDPVDVPEPAGVMRPTALGDQPGPPVMGMRRPGRLRDLPGTPESVGMMRPAVLADQPGPPVMGLRRPGSLRDIPDMPEPVAVAMRPGLFRDIPGSQPGSVAPPALQRLIDLPEQPQVPLARQIAEPPASRSGAMDQIEHVVTGLARSQGIEVTPEQLARMRGMLEEAPELRNWRTLSPERRQQLLIAEASRAAGIAGVRVTPAQLDAVVAFARQPKKGAGKLLRDPGMVVGAAQAVYEALPQSAQNRLAARWKRLSPMTQRRLIAAGKVAALAAPVLGAVLYDYLDKDEADALAEEEVGAEGGAGQELVASEATETADQPAEEPAAAPAQPVVIIMQPGQQPGVVMQPAVTVPAVPAGAVDVGTVPQPAQPYDPWAAYGEAMLAY